MRQVNVIIHLDLGDGWTDRDLERFILGAVRPQLAGAVAVDAEVMPGPERPDTVPWPEDVPPAALLDEDVPPVLRPTLRQRLRATGWTV
jgi:hypothetical protein